MFVYMNIAKNSKIMRLRGEVDDDYEDMNSHIKKQAQLGYVVKTSNKLVGEVNPKTSHIECTMEELK